VVVSVWGVGGEWMGGGLLAPAPPTRLINTSWHLVGPT
jgi:hypothetical protein